MNLLVTTSKFVLIIDTGTYDARILHFNSGIYYGACVDGENNTLYVATRNSILGPYVEGARPSERGSILVFNDRAVTIDNLMPDFPLRDLHSIMHLDRKIWAVCSFDNMVAIFDTRTRAWDRWYPSPFSDKRHQDADHYNTITHANGSIHLVAHNRGPSDILEYGYPDLDLLRSRELGVHSHDLLFRDGDVHTLSSLEGMVVSGNGMRLRTGHYPRGLAFCGGHHYVGLSAFAPRLERNDQSAALRVFDAGWVFVRDILLKDVGMIFHILPLDRIAMDTARLPAFAGIELVPSGYAGPWDPLVYDIGAERCDADLHRNEWHRGEGSGRWTAARHARAGIVVNPGCRTLHMTLMSMVSGIAGTVLMNGVPVGRFAFDQPGSLSFAGAIPEGMSGRCVLEIAVDRLWQPAREFPDCADHRRLGVRVEGIRIA